MDVNPADRANEARSNDAVGNGKPRKVIVERSAAFADQVIRLTRKLPNDFVGHEIGRQLVRAGMSVGANVEEAQAAESKPDFIHKMSIARKECREATYFLTRLANAGFPPQDEVLRLVGESGELTRILTAILCTARSPGRNETVRVVPAKPRPGNGSITRNS